MIVITGASDGLGLQLAKLYKEADKMVVNISRRPCKYADHNILHNLREGSEIEKAAKEVSAINEPLEVLVNCTGVLSLEPFGEITEDEIKRVMSSNVKSAMLLTSSLIDRIRRDGTDIVNISSTASQKGSAKTPVYSASKWALSGFSASLREELRNTPSRVVTVCPDIFDSDLFVKVADATDVDKSKWISTEKLAKLIASLLDLPKNMEISDVTINRKKLSH